MRRAIIFFIMLIFGIGIGTLFANRAHAPTNALREVDIVFENGTRVTAEVVATPESRALGLGHRASLDWDRSMLFLYDKPSVQQFWMKGMQFPIDIIWLGEGVVAGVIEDIPPPQNELGPLPLYASGEPVSSVLEVNAGFFANHSLTIGMPFRVEE